MSESSSQVSPTSCTGSFARLIISYCILLTVLNCPPSVNGFQSSQRSSFPTTIPSAASSLASSATTSVYKRQQSRSRIQLSATTEGASLPTSETTTTAASKKKKAKKKKTKGATKAATTTKTTTAKAKSKSTAEPTASTKSTKGSHAAAKAKAKVRGETKASRPPQPQAKHNHNHNNNNKHQQKKKHNNNKNYNNKRKGYNNNKNYKRKKFSRRGSWDSPAENRKLNQQIVSHDTAQGLLNFIGQQKGALSSLGGGGILNSVNLSTALHRLAKHVMYNNYGDDENNTPQSNEANRAKILADPRFALLLCITAEALDEKNNIQLVNPPRDKIVFSSREMSNIAWALAKYKIVPPQRVMPVLHDDNDDTTTTTTTTNDSSSSSMQLLQEKCQQVRTLVYQVAKERAARGEAPGGYDTTWVPALSQLSAHLMDCFASRVLTVRDETSQFQLQEYANFLWALATTQRGEEKIFTYVLGQLMSGMKLKIAHNQVAEGLRPQEWSNSIWALATTGISGPDEELLPFVAELMDEYPDFVGAFKPQELSNTAWGVATILSKQSATQLEGPTSDAALRIFRHVARQMIARKGEGYKSQEVTNTVWAFATLGFGLSSASSARYLVDSNRYTDYTFLKSYDEEGDKQLMEGAVRVVMDTAIQKQLRYYRSQELNNMAWSMNRLDQRDDELLRLIGRELSNTKRHVTSQDIGTTLWSFASIEFFDDEIYRSIAYRLTPDRAVKSKPQELSNIVWALATADVVPQFLDVFDTTYFSSSQRTSVAQAQRDPVTRSFALAAQELMRRPHEFKTQEIKDTLWAFSRVGLRHPALFRCVADHLVGTPEQSEISGRGLDDFSPQGLGNLAWAYARQAQLGAEICSKNTILPLNSGRLAHYTTIFIDVGEALMQKLFLAIADTDLRVHDGLGKLKPQDLSNTAWAFAILGMKHTRFLEAVVYQLRLRTEACRRGSRDSYNRFKSQEIANALWALATLNHTPDGGLLSELEPFLLDMGTSGNGELSVKSISNSFKRQELANIVWICAVFREYPPNLVKLLYRGLIGFGENEDPQYLKRMHADEGLQQSAVMSLIYLQIVMDLDLGNSNPFYLPTGFPDNWEPGKRDGEMSDDTGFFDLQLTSSKIQTSVSSAFQRIGFQHVEEHVISMADLAGDYGVQVEPNSQEILSLDIADVNSKIGIEVDGPAHFITAIDKGNNSRGDNQSINGNLEYQFNWGSDRQEVNGPTALKLRMLKQLGWHVISLPFWEWYVMDGAMSRQEDYCRSLLEKE